MKKIILSLIVPILLLVLAFPTVGTWWYQYLAAHQPVNDADILLVEGWISEKSLTQAVNEFHNSNYQFLAVASILLPETYMIHSPGALVFPVEPTVQTDTVEISAYSTPAGGAHARMHVYVNQQEVGSQMTHSAPDTYQFYSPVDSLREVAVVYQDDHYDWEAGEDRNLYVTSVRLGSEVLHPRTDSAYFDRGKMDGNKLQTIHQSEAGITTELLKRMDIPEAKIILIEAPEEQINKTHTTARTVSRWLTQQPSVSSVNLFTESTHARRSWLLYRKALPENIQVGIISSEPDGYDAHNWWKDPAGRGYVISQTMKYGYALLTYFFI